MTTPELPITLDVGDAAVSGVFAGPEDSFATLVVAHGAGAGMDHPFLVGFTRALVPMKKFMLEHVRAADLKLFSDMAKTKPTNDPAQVAVTTLAPAFMLSELKRAFEIGFLIFVPFLIIDMAVASILMSMGMMMLPPVIISLPFKLIFFVLVDGWRLIAGSLVQSYMHSPPPT